MEFDHLGIPQLAILISFARWAGDVTVSLRLEERMEEVAKKQALEIEGLEHFLQGETYSARLRDDVSSLFLKTTPRGDGPFPTVITECLLKLREERTISLESPEMLETFERLIDGSRASLGRMPKTPILRAKNLRGVVTEIGPYEYAMRAYLTELEWEHGLRSRARNARAYFGSIEDAFESSEDRSPSSQVDSDSESIAADGAVTWVIDADLRQVITVDEFCLVYARGTWARPVADFELAAVFFRFQSLLEILSGERNVDEFQ